jgi:hypothetical protein
MTTMKKDRYRPTESKYKGGAHQMYVTYDVQQKTRSGGSAMYPKVKRVYIAGDVKDWKTGAVQKRSGRSVQGVRIEYEQGRGRHHRKGFTAHRGDTGYEVAPASVHSSAQKFVQVVELPKDARNVHFYTDKVKLPAKYQHALQNVR